MKLCLFLLTKPTWPSGRKFERQSGRRSRPHEESLRPEIPTDRNAKNPIRLGESPDCSESSLCVHIVCLLCNVLVTCSLFMECKLIGL